MYKPLLCCVVVVLLCCVCAGAQPKPFGLLSSLNKITEHYKSLRNTNDNLPCIQCKTTGQSCDYSDNLWQVCTGDSYCNVDICVNQVVDGQPCSESHQCISGYCKGTCQDKRDIFSMGFAGNPCKTSDDCFGDLTCTNQICTGTSLGGSCSSSDQCNQGLACINNKCAKYLQIGQSCEPVKNRISPYGPCAPFAECVRTSETDPTLGTCVDITTVPINGLCSIDAMCPDNTMCIKGNLSYCQTVPSSSFKSCTTSDDCDPQEECACNNAETASRVCVQTLTPNQPGARAALIEAASCVKTHCSGISEGTCAATRCLEEVCVMHEFTVSTFISKTQVYPECYVQELIESIIPRECIQFSATKETQKRSVVGLAVGVTFAGIVVLAVGIFGFMKRKTIYERVFRKPYPYEKNIHSTSIYDEEDYYVN